MTKHTVQFHQRQLIWTTRSFSHLVLLCSLNGWQWSRAVSAQLALWQRVGLSLLGQYGKRMMSCWWTQKVIMWNIILFTPSVIIRSRSELFEHQCSPLTHAHCLALTLRVLQGTLDWISHQMASIMSVSGFKVPQWLRNYKVQSLLLQLHQARLLWWKMSMTRLCSHCSTCLLPERCETICISVC